MSNETLHIYFHPSDSEPAAIIDLPEKPFWSNEKYSRYESPIEQYNLELKNYEQALASAIENRLKIVNIGLFEDTFLPLGVTYHQFFENFPQGREWPGTFEKVCKWNGNREACGNETCWDLNECQKNPEAVRLIPSAKSLVGERTFAETIALIREGKMAIENNGTKEQLIQLSKIIWPHDPIVPLGVGKFYFGRDDEWDDVSRLELVGIDESIPVTDLLALKEKESAAPCEAVGEEKLK